jgi:hypothetical protein
MRSIRFLPLLIMVVFVFSCSKDDPEPSIEQVSLSLSKDSQLIEVPAAMMNSEDDHAQMAAGFVALANGMGGSLALFTPPAGATKSTDIITPLNGRLQKGSAAVVYIWNDPQYGSVAYQVRDASDKYTFELFYKGNDDAGWYRYLYAQEMKDKTAGYMVLYDAWGFINDTRSAEMVRWEWTRSGDDFTFIIRDLESAFNFTIEVNTKTKAGSIIYTEDNEKLYEMTWDGQGKGTWKEFENNQVIAEGTWS